MSAAPVITLPRIEYHLAVPVDLATQVLGAPVEVAYDVDLDGAPLATVYRIAVPDPLLADQPVTRWVAIGPNAQMTHRHTSRSGAVATFLCQARGWTAWQARKTARGRR